MREMKKKLHDQKRHDGTLYPIESQILDLLNDRQIYTYVYRRTVQHGLRTWHCTLVWTDVAE